jgi:hypothetical protein
MAELYALLGRSAVAVDDRATARESIRFLRKLRFPVTDGVAAGLQGAMAARAGDDDEARRLLMLAARLCDESGFALYGAAYRYRLGEMTSGGEGDRLRQEVVDGLSAGGVVAPLRMVAYHAPSFATGSAGLLTAGGG